MRALTSEDLLAVWDLGHDRHAVDRALVLLARAMPEVAWGDLVRLSPGERDGLLLTVRQTTFGPTMTMVARCPDCGEPQEFTATCDELTLAPPPSATALHRPEPRFGRIERDGYTVDYRAPDSRDLAEVAAAPDVDTAARRLMERCVRSAWAGGAAVAVNALPPEVAAAVAEALDTDDPQGNVAFGFACPGCGREWAALLDLAHLLWRDVATCAQGVLEQVHALATAYGWREPDILAMSPARRHFYLTRIGK